MIHEYNRPTNLGFLFESRGSQNGSMISSPFVNFDKTESIWCLQLEIFVRRTGHQIYIHPCIRYGSIGDLHSTIPGAFTWTRLSLNCYCCRIPKKERKKQGARRKKRGKRKMKETISIQITFHFYIYTLDIITFFMCNKKPKSQKTIRQRGGKKAVMRAPQDDFG